MQHAAQKIYGEAFLVLQNVEDRVTYSWGDSGPGCGVRIPVLVEQFSSKFECFVDWAPDEEAVASAKNAAPTRGSTTSRLCTDKASDPGVVDRWKTAWSDKDTR